MKADFGGVMTGYKRSFIGRWAIISGMLLSAYGAYNIMAWIFAQDFLTTYSFTGHPPGIDVVIAILALTMGYFGLVFGKPGGMIGPAAAIFVLIFCAYDLTEHFFGFQLDLLRRALLALTGIEQIREHTLTYMEIIGAASCAVLLLDARFPNILHYSVTAIFGGIITTVTFFGLFTLYFNVPQNIALFEVSSQAPAMIGIVGLMILTVMVNSEDIKPRSIEIGVSLAMAIGGLFAVLILWAVLSRNVEDRIINFSNHMASFYAKAQQVNNETKVTLAHERMRSLASGERHMTSDALFNGLPSTYAMVITQKDALFADGSVYSRHDEQFEPKLLELLDSPNGQNLAVGPGAFASLFVTADSGTILSMQFELQGTDYKGALLSDFALTFRDLYEKARFDGVAVVVHWGDEALIFKSDNADYMFEHYGAFISHQSLVNGELVLPFKFLPPEESIASFQDVNLDLMILFSFLNWGFTTFIVSRWLANRRMREELATKARSLQDDFDKVQERRDQIEQFATVAAHDMKSPLNAILSIEEWLREDLEPSLNDETRGMFDEIEARVTHLRDMAGDLLSYYRADKEDAHIETVDLNELLNMVAASQSVERKHSIDWDYMPTIETAQAPLEQVLSNLIGNAIKYHDGEVATIHAQAVQRGEFWRFTISDDGPGIPRNMLDKIFEPFGSALPKSKRKGTGLGLSIVRRHVMALGGEVGVDIPGIEGKGASFYFDWPNVWPTKG